jgi:hypothetical protein
LYLLSTAGGTALDTRLPEWRRNWPGKPNAVLYRSCNEVACETANVILLPETVLIGTIFRWTELEVAVTFSCNSVADVKESDIPPYSTCVYLRPASDGRGGGVACFAKTTARRVAGVVVADVTSVCFVGVAVGITERRVGV